MLRLALRGVLTKIVPNRVKRVVEQRETRRFLAEASRLNRAYVAQHGSEVRRGPFAGLRYGDELLDRSGDLVAKLVGAYEAELHDAVGRWIANAPETVVNIGAGEGYYAVGFAHAAPGTTVLAHDIDTRSQQLCTAMAARNGVADRVRVGGECTLEMLAQLPARAGALMLDCEGAERELLRPDLVPPMRHWPILVELHDFIDPTISETVLARMEATHEARILPAGSRSATDYPELAALTPAETALLLSERRPSSMRWAVLTPRCPA